MRRLGTHTAGALTAVLALLLSGCSGEGPPQLSTTGAFIPEPVSSDMAAGFLTIANTGESADALTGVTSDVADSVEMHQTIDNAMRPVDALPVPAQGELKLSRGGDHLMLLGLEQELKQDGKVSLELHFEKSDSITIEVPVAATTYTGE